MQTTKVLALILMVSGLSRAAMTAPAAADQPRATLVDDAHTLFTPNAPAAGRPGQTFQLPQGGTGVTTGGTSQYQTYTAPGSSGVAVPSGNGSSTLLGSGGRTGAAPAPR